MKNICDYGCGKEANYVLKNKKNCCSTSWHKCEYVCVKNSERIKQTYANGRQTIFTKEHREKSREAYRQNIIDNVNNFFTKSKFHSGKILKRLLVEYFNVEYKCDECGIIDWLGQPLTLELHHKDGDKYNNEVKNLQILCPNCHALTSNFRNKKRKCPSGGTGDTQQT